MAKAGVASATKKVKKPHPAHLKPSEDLVAAVDAYASSVGGNLQQARTDIGFNQNSFSDWKNGKYSGNNRDAVSTTTKYLNGFNNYKSTCRPTPAQEELGKFIVGELQHILNENIKFLAEQLPKIGIPFCNVDAEFYLWAHVNPALPAPNYGDYEAGRVECSAADDELETRLSERGVCYVEGAASSGKTTLAMRAAYQHVTNQKRVIYLNLGEDIDRQAILATLETLKARNDLVIIDNANRSPKIARDAYAIWLQNHREHPDTGARLIILATIVSSEIARRVEDTLEPIKANMLTVRPDAAYLGKLANFYFKKGGGSGELNPSLDVLNKWEATFGQHLHAFGAAVMNSIQKLQTHHFELNMENAYAYVRHNWLKTHDARTGQNADIAEAEWQNLLCISACAAQSLELGASIKSLPSPGQQNLHHISSLGIIVRRNVGRHAQYERIELVEPGWGGLILDSRDVDSATREKAILDAATRDPFVALRILGRTFKRGNGNGAYVPTNEREIAIWAFIANANDTYFDDMVASGLFSLQRWIEIAIATEGKSAIEARLWLALNRWLETHPDELLTAPLQQIDTLLITALRQKPDSLNNIWEVLIAQKDRFMKCLWNSTFHVIEGLAKKAPPESGLSNLISETIFGDMNKLLDLALQTAIRDVTKIFVRAAGHDKLHETDYVAQFTAAVLAAYDAMKLAIAEADAAEFWEFVRDKTPKEVLVHYLHDYEMEAKIIDNPQWTYNGALWTARHCEYIGLNNIFEAVTEKLANRQNMADFNSEPGRDHMRYFHIAWVHNHQKSEPKSLEFVKTVCSDKTRLDSMYKKNFPTAIAEILTEFSKTRSPNLIAEINRPALRSRVKALSNQYHDMDEEKRPEIIRLIGAYASFLDIRTFLFGDLPNLTQLENETLNWAIADKDYLQKNQRQYMLGIWACLGNNQGSEIPIEAAHLAQFVTLIEGNIKTAEESNQYPSQGVLNANIKDWFLSCQTEGQARLTANWFDIRFPLPIIPHP